MNSLEELLEKEPQTEPSISRKRPQPSLNLKQLIFILALIAILIAITAIYIL